jgi:hypothetical protein
MFLVTSHECFDYSGHILIIIYEKDMFDYSSGEPPEDMLTVLRALEVRPMLNAFYSTLIVLFSRSLTLTSCEF